MAETSGLFNCVWKTSWEREDRDEAKDRMAVRSERWWSVTRLLNEAWNGILYYISVKETQGENMEIPKFAVDK